MVDRFTRQMSLPSFPDDGIERLGAARIAVVGAGGLGAPCLMYLAAAGIGNLTVIDFDVVDESNLARQILYTPADLGTSKATTAALRLSDMNPAIAVRAIDTRLDAESAPQLLAECDIVIDACDNFETRYVLNDYCVSSGYTYIWGALGEYSGRVGAVIKGKGACFRCLFPEPWRSTGDGVFGPVCGVVGSLMAGHALRAVWGLESESPLTMTEIDLLTGRCDEIPVNINPTCISHRNP